ARIPIITFRETIAVSATKKKRNLPPRTRFITSSCSLNGTAAPCSTHVAFCRLIRAPRASKFPSDKTRCGSLQDLSRRVWGKHLDLFRQFHADLQEFVRVGV